MRKIATVILAAILLIGIVAAQEVSICPWDEPEPQELTPEESSISSTLIGNVVGFVDVCEDATISQTTNSTFNLLGSSFYLHSGLGSIELGHSTNVNTYDTTMGITQSNAMAFDGTMSMLVGDTHTVQSVNPVTPITENTTIVCAWCQLDHGGSSADLDSGVYVSDTALQSVPFENGIDYIVGVSGIQGINPNAAGSFRTFESARVISGAITNGTITSDYNEDYSIRANFVGDMNITRVYSRFISYPHY